MFDGYILVGGASSRMKTNKAALRLGEMTFAERAVTALQKITERRIYFVTGGNQTDGTNKFLPPDIPRITDVFPNKAAIGGIYTALTHSKNKWAAILACDFPLVTKELFARLAKITESVDANVSAIVPTQPDGRVQPLCALYRVEPCLIAAKHLLKSEEIPSAGELSVNVNTRFVSIMELSDLRGSENFFSNVNTPEDFLRVQSIFQTMQNN